MYGEFDRFQILYDDIPRDGHSSLYIEDDGRQYRYFEFKDTTTGEVYNFSYVWHSEFPFNPSTDIMDDLDGIVIVNQSVLKLIEEPPVVVPPEPILSAEEIADKELWAKYNAVLSEMTPMNPSKKVPKAVISDIIAFLKTDFNMYQLRAKILPVCITYRIEHKSFWEYIQVKRGAWKRSK